MPEQFQNIFRTFASRSYDNEEWNPLNQVLPLQTQKRVNSRFFGHQMLDSWLNVYRRVTAVHEAMHILLLEPFFIGKLNFKSLQDFEYCYLAFEGATVWHMELTATPAYDSKHFDGESLYARAGITTPSFSHRAALRALSTSSEDETLKLYIDCFTGCHTKLAQSDNIYARNLAVRLYSSFFDSKKPMQLLHNQLTSLGIIDEFQNRFCKIPNLPTILPPTVTKFNPSKEMSDYCHCFFRLGIPHMDRLPLHQVQLIRIRRKLQTRAYFAFCLLRALERKQFFSRKATFSTKEIPQIVADLKEYLVTLEGTLQQPLLQGKSKTCNKEIAAADKFFDCQIFKKLKKLDLWMSKRLLYAPPGQSMSLGYIGHSESRKIKLKDFSNLAQLFLKYPHDESITLEKKIEEIVELSKNRGNPTVYNRIISQPHFRKVWSQPLYSINPNQENYRELFVKDT